jgi:AcrR family transcriptional regulator
MAMTEADAAVAAKQSDPRYQRLMEATRAAAREGYDAVSMRQLAETCRLSMTTIYQFCGSKDQLIAEAHLENMETFRALVSANPPRGATAEDRVLRVMRSFAKALEVDEALSRTLMRAMYSLEPEVADVRADVGQSYATMLDAAIGDADLQDRAAVIATLGHVIDSVILGWLTRRHDVVWVRRQLESAVRALLGDAGRAAKPRPRASRRR